MLEETQKLFVSIFKEPLYINLYYTYLGLFAFVLYFFTRNKTLGIIAFNMNIAILLTTEYIRLIDHTTYKCFSNYLSENIVIPSVLIKCSLLCAHYIPALFLLYKLNSLLAVSMRKLVFYSLMSSLIFVSWCCITSDCIELEDVYLTYDKGSCSDGMTKKYNIKLILLMLFGNFLLPLSKYMRSFVK